MNRPGLVIPLTLVVCALGALGQTLLKLSLSRLPAGQAALATLACLLRDPAFWAGGVVVAMGTSTWLYVLHKAQITYAMPFLSFTFVFVMITSSLILHEPQPLGRIAGTLAIVIGMFLVGLSR
ncbi:MAG: EamA family transporter [Anaeromyxobacteraceae bacterium]